MSETKKRHVVREGKQRGHAEVYNGEYYSLGWSTVIDAQLAIALIANAVSGQHRYHNDYENKDHSNNAYYEGLVVDCGLGGSQNVEHVGLPNPLTPEGIVEILHAENVALSLLSQLRINTSQGDIAFVPGYLTVLSHIPVAEWQTLISKTYDQSQIPEQEMQALVALVKQEMKG